MYTTCEFIQGSDIEYAMHSIYTLLTSHKIIQNIENRF